MLYLMSCSWKCQRIELQLLMGTSEIVTGFERCSAITEEQTGLLKDGAGAGLATDAADSKRLPLGEPQVFIHDQNRSILVTNL